MGGCYHRIPRMPASKFIRRAIYVVACLAPGWAAIAGVLDGIILRVGPVRFSSTEPVRPLLFGGVAFALYLSRSSRRDIEADAAWLTLWFTRLAKAATPLVILLGCAVGLIYGTFSAAGSDAYGYVSQAALWIRGDLRIEQPIVQQVSWPLAAWTFTPLGYRPVSDAGVIVPTYPPGLPMLMAVFTLLFGDRGPFFVVPALASVALACTCWLGKIATGSSNVGTVAALLLLASPAFIGHSIVPMTDVPATAGWALVCVAALKEPRPRPILAGLAAGATLLVRPNLILLAGAPVLAWIFSDGTLRPVAPSIRRNIAGYALGMLPALIAFVLVNLALYGAPFETGYGSLGDNYGLHTATQNVRNYTSWLLDTQSPMVLLALIPVFVPRALRGGSARVCLLAMMALTFVSYVFYAQFENWTYLRFLLPGYPALFVSMAAAMRIICLRLPLPARLPAAILLISVAALLSFRFARDQYVFDWRTHEQRYVHAAARAAELTPKEAVLFSSQHSGSLRYYAHRLTLRYDLLAGELLDSAIRELEEKGRPSFLGIDVWEQMDFRKRFSGDNRTGGLDWAPLARVTGPPDVLIYDLNPR
jgi:hypothetical protein